MKKEIQGDGESIRVKMTGEEYKEVTRKWLRHSRNM